jgi:hypothetical protein
MPKTAGYKHLNFQQIPNFKRILKQSNAATVYMKMHVLEEAQYDAILIRWFSHVSRIWAEHDCIPGST